MVSEHFNIYCIHAVRLLLNVIVVSEHFNNIYCIHAVRLFNVILIIALGSQVQAYTPTLGLLLHLLKECTTDCQAVMDDGTTGLSGKEQVC